MKSIPKTAVLAGIVLSSQGCGGGTLVQIPPRIDLTQHQILGVIEFTSSAEGNLAPYTTRTFIEEMRADQGMIRVVELGPQTELLESLGLTRLDRATFRAIAEEHGLTTIVTGELEVSGVRPSISIRPNLSGIAAAADVDADLGVRMIEAASGASIWSRSADATHRVGHVNVLGGRFDFDAEDPEEAYGDLVRALVRSLTTDFRFTYERRRNQIASVTKAARGVGITHVRFSWSSTAESRVFDAVEPASPSPADLEAYLGTYFSEELDDEQGRVVGFTINTATLRNLGFVGR